MREMSTAETAKCTLVKVANAGLLGGSCRMVLFGLLLWSHLSLLDFLLVTWCHT